MHEKTSLSLGNKAFNEGDYRSAIRFYQLSKNDSPKHSEIVNFNLTLAKFRLEKTDKKFTHKSLDIIVCIHNALEDVKKCLSSIEKATETPYRLILVNDGSDASTKGYLIDFSSRREYVEVLHSDKATGYTKAANRGLRLSSADYVALLNSDTIVTPEWEKNIIAAGEENPALGILGPLSNSATYQSVPRVKDADGDWATNLPPDNLSIEKIAKEVHSAGQGRIIETPFVNGFCFFIKREVVNKIGHLDELSFPRGYGEENDYCIRAGKAGYKLGIVCSSYVFHALSKSFKKEGRKKLQVSGRQSLRDKHGKDFVVSLTRKMTGDTSGLEDIREKIGDLYKKANGSVKAEKYIDFYSSEEFLCKRGLCHDKKDNFMAFMKASYSNEVYVSFFESVFVSGAGGGGHPLSGEWFECIGSYNVRNKFNVLAFGVAGEAKFYFLQWVSFCDGVFFPEENSAVFLHHFNKEAFRLCQKAGAFSKFPKTVRKFGGLICSHNRPYHYFYDVLPGIELLREKFPRLNKIVPDFYSLRGGDFYPFDLLYGFKPTVSVDSEFLNEMSEKEGKYFVNVGILGIEFNKNNLPWLRKLDDRIRKLSSGNGTAKENDANNQLCVIFNINSQKRVWLSQEDSIPKLIDELSTKYGGELLVVFDGWTMPSSPNKEDFDRVREDLQAARKMAASCNKEVCFEYLMGRTAYEKLKFINKVDVFVSCHATGSMYVSRICKKPGVTHHNGMFDLSAYIHHDKVTVLDKKNIIVETMGSERINPYNVSYDFDWKILKGILLNKIGAKVS